MQPTRSSQHGHDQHQGAPFPVLGVVASAAGVATFIRLWQQVPSHSGMAFVFIPNGSAEPAGALASVLSAAGIMPVIEVARKTTMQSGNVYVIPPDTLMRITGSVLAKAPRREQRSALRPIDYFLESLALDRKDSSIAIVISGLEADGARGLERIREAGGIAAVLSESSPEDWIPGLRSS